MVFTMTKGVNMYILTFVLLLLARLPVSADDIKLVSYERYANEAVNTFVKEMEKLGLDCVGSGGRMPYDVERIDVMFSVRRRATIEEARKLEVKAVEKLLQAINAHEKLRPYLREYPFTPARVNVRITFKGEHGSYYSDRTVALMDLIRGNINYDSYDPINDKFEDILSEPYEQAVAIVQGNAPQQDRDLCVHQAKPYEARMDQLFRDFAKEVKAKWGIFCAAEGGKMADGIEEVAIKFITPKRTPLEKARELEVQITERLLQIINSDEGLRPYLKEYPFTVDRTRVAILIKKRDYSHYTDGSVALVHQEDNKIFYLTQPPDPPNKILLGPVLLKEESFEEAKTLLQKFGKCL